VKQSGAEGVNRPFQGLLEQGTMWAVLCDCISQDSFQRIIHSMLIERKQQNIAWHTSNNSFRPIHLCGDAEIGPKVPLLIIER
jgi:hypothetical protein